MADPIRLTLFQVFEKPGLKLESREAPVETFVIDHVEKPTENQRRRNDETVRPKREPYSTRWPGRPRQAAKTCWFPIWLERCLVRPASSRREALLT
jgi:hypothetical protein